MKFNKWTLGLAAVGVVSFASAARADEMKVNMVQTAVANTTISGSVSASMNWELTPGEHTVGESPAQYIPFQGPTKENGFNLDVVRLTIAKPEDATQWASGYQVDLMFGPDAVGYNPSANGSSGQDFSIKQAYVTLNTPVGNGLDWKVGVFDTVIGYESTDAQNDPNYTRSWGYTIEPTEHTGVLATYTINKQWSISAGVANTLEAGINTRAFNYPYDYGDDYSTDWHKTFMGAVTFNAPDSWNWAAGSTFTAGIVYGFNGQYGADKGFHAGGDQINYYAGGVLNTPLKQLTLGAAFDYAHNFDGGGNWWAGYWEYNVLAAGVYAKYQATDKLSLNGRAEYVYGERVGNNYFESYTDSADGLEFTGTLEYDMWANVISRLELRWDHANTNYSALGDYLDHKDSVGLYANVIYKF